MTQSPLFAQGMLKVKENDHHGAILIFTQVLAAEPKNADALSQRAVAYLNLEQYELSMTDMNLAIEYDPEYAYRYQCRGYLKARLKDHEGAVADYEKAVELDPEDGIAYNNLALALEQMGYQQKSRANFDKSDELMGIKPRTYAEAPKNETTPPEKKVNKTPKATTKNPVKDKKSKKGAIAKSVFTKKSAFKEFIQFIKNGFKIKK